MLIITRRPGEKLMIGDDVVVEVIEISGSSVRIGIAAPKSIPVYREEIYTAVKEENAASASASPDQIPADLPSPADSKEPPVVPPHQHQH
jgi:carbon storage regulator